MERKRTIGVVLIVLIAIVVLLWMQSWENKEPVKFVNCDEAWEQVRTGQTTFPGAENCPGTL